MTAVGAGGECLAGATTGELIAELLHRGGLDDDEDGVVLLARLGGLAEELSSEMLEARRADFLPDDAGKERDR